MAATFLGLDLGLGALAGLVVGGLASRGGHAPHARSLALGLAAAYALFRIYDPPGLGTEAAFALVAAALAALGAALAGPAGGPLVFVHLTLLTSATVALGGWALDELAGVAEEDIDPFLVARYGARYDRSIRVLYDGTYKLIRTSRGERMLFDLARDPAEHDLAAAEPERAADLQRRLDTALGTLVARN